MNMPFSRIGFLHREEAAASMGDALVIQVPVDGTGRAMAEAVSTQFGIANAVDLNWRHEN